MLTSWQAEITLYRYATMGEAQGRERLAQRTKSQLLGFSSFER
ncbi:hypothetical protein [Mesorhizobium sp. 128a]